MKTTSFLFFLLFVLSMGIFPDITELKIIVNPGVQVFELKDKDIRDIYTGVKKMWDTGGKVSIAILEDSELHRQFLQEFVNKTPIQFRNFWREKVFTGEGENPKSFKTEASIIEFVANTRGAIGYISYISSPMEKPVKIIDVKIGK